MRTIATVLLFVSSSLCRADVTIEKQNRVSNLGYGVCAWSSIEMAGRQGRIKQVKGLAAHRDKESRRKVKHIQYNWTPGNGWTYELKEVEQRNNGGTVERMRQQLDVLGVKYVSQLEGVRDEQILYDGTKDGATGCVVGLRNYAYTDTDAKRNGCLIYKDPRPWRTLGYHAVLVIHIDDDCVKFMDPNDVRDPWIVSRRWFNAHWDGSGMVITPKPSDQETVIVSHKEESRPVATHPRWVQVLIQSGMSEKDALLTWNRMQGKEQ